MKLIIKKNNTNLSPSLKNYIEDKIKRLAKFYDNINTAEIELISQQTKSDEMSQKVEVTLHANGHIFRCEESTISMYASIDIVSEKLERQLRKFKEKINKRKRVKSVVQPEDRSLSDKPPFAEIVKVKQFAIKPMSPEEASLQMEMIGHDFYVFFNANSNVVNVIYKRKDGNYGLIEPLLE